MYTTWKLELDLPRLTNSTHARKGTFGIHINNNRLATKYMRYDQVYVLLRNNDLYVCGIFVYKEFNDEKVGTIYKKQLARRIRMVYSLDKKRIHKTIWSA